MGAALASVCRGTRLWVSEGRSASTRQRAVAASMDEVPSLDAAVERAEVVVSICPPAAAVEVARAVQRAGFDGIYVDANAIAPATARVINGFFGRFVDGAVMGPPVKEPGRTRLCLAGAEAPAVAELWRDTALETRVIGGGAGAASAVKVCYAAWTKGSAALLLAVRALAQAEGVTDALFAEWEASIPELIKRSEKSAVVNAPKAWRFVGEMEEIAAALAADDLPAGFAQAAADVYHRLACFKDASSVAAADVIDTLAASAGAAKPDGTTA